MNEKNRRSLFNKKLEQGYKSRNSLPYRKEYQPVESNNNLAKYICLNLSPGMFIDSNEKLRKGLPTYDDKQVLSQSVEFSYNRFIRFVSTLQLQIMNDNNKIPGLPERIYYIPDFINEEEENRILRNVYSVPKPRWTYLSNRKVQNWGGIPHAKGMISEEIPCWLRQYVDLCTETGAFPKDKSPNHVLVNEYLPGQGIMPHLDGPLFYPTTCIITCGSHTVLNFHPKPDKDSDCSKSKYILYEVLLERKSLIIIQEDMYKIYPHSIEEKKTDIITDKIANLHMCSGQYELGKELIRETRISLTITNVLQTCKFNLKFFK